MSAPATRLVKSVQTVMSFELWLVVDTHRFIDERLALAEEFSFSRIGIFSDKIEHYQLAL